MILGLSLFVGVVLLWVLFFVIVSPFAAPGVAVIGSRLFLNSFFEMCIFYDSIVFAVGNSYPHFPFVVGDVYLTSNSELTHYNIKKMRINFTIQDSKNVLEVQVIELRKF